MTSGRLLTAAAQTRSEADARSTRVARREADLARTSDIGRAEGVSDRLIADSEASMRSAFALGDMMDGLFGGRR